VPAEHARIRLAKVERFALADDATPRVGIDNWFLLALVQFALRHGAVTLADLEEPDELPEVEIAGQENMASG